MYQTSLLIVVRSIWTMDFWNSYRFRYNGKGMQNLIGPRVPVLNAKVQDQGFRGREDFKRVSRYHILAWWPPSLTDCIHRNKNDTSISAKGFDLPSDFRDMLTHKLPLSLSLRGAKTLQQLGHLQMGRNWYFSWILFCGLICCELDGMVMKHLYHGCLENN